MDHSGMRGVEVIEETIFCGWTHSQQSVIVDSFNRCPKDMSWGMPKTELSFRESRELENAIGMHLSR
jgi:hypothetical protein